MEAIADIPKALDDLLANFQPERLKAVVPWLKSLHSDHATLQEENKKLREKNKTLTYALADASNDAKLARDRNRKDCAEAEEQITRRISMSLLPVLDSLNDAVAQEKNCVHVFSMIRDSMESALNANGLSEVDCSGEYDMLMHEAVIKHDGMKITRCVRRGYKLGEKLIRVARVEVGTTPA